MRLISAIVMLLAAVSVSAATRVDSLREAIYSPAPFKKPIVIAHRGDWRSGTENSLRAIRRCIDMGVDIVELDIAMTRDSVLVLMHDDTIDRTTTGSGRVSDYTLEQLKEFNLRSPIGVVTRQKIPTFKEALALCRGRLLVQVDKWPHLKERLLKDAAEAGCLDHIILRSSWSSLRKNKEIGVLPREVIYIPVLVCKGDGDDERLDDFLANFDTPVISFSFRNTDYHVLRRIKEVRDKGYHVWLNSLWSTFNGGHDDELAYENPAEAYGWLIDMGADMIFTDHPALLVDYLTNDLKQNN